MQELENAIDKLSKAIVKSQIHGGRVDIDRDSLVLVLQAASALHDASRQFIQPTTL